MGQKVNPVSYRLQVNKNWSSKWFSRKADFKNWLIEDVKIREVIENRFKSRPTIDRIGIERSPNLTTITIRTAKAGAVIGKQGAGINELKKELEKVTNAPLRINVEEVKKPELSAKLVAENIGRCAKESRRTHGSRNEANAHGHPRHRAATEHVFLEIFVAARNPQANCK